MPVTCTTPWLSVKKSCAKSLRSISPSAAILSWFSASDQNSAYRIFSILNDRGLDLSPTDILKADIIGALPENIRSRHTEIWEEVEEDLGRDRFSDLFAHIRMISMKRRQQGTLQQEFQDHVLKAVDRGDFINIVLEPYADAYATVTGASYESTDGSGEVNKYLRYLNQLDNFDWIPPAMAFYRRNQSPEAFLRFVRDLERLAYAMFIVRANVYRRTSIYADILRAIDHEEDLYGVSSPLQLSSEKWRTFCVRWTAPSAPSHECAGLCSCALIRYWQTEAPGMNTPRLRLSMCSPGTLTGIHSG